ncbi:MAG: isoprenoid biosynthesis glyoxalase ElbB [Bdellovibrionales bacterium]|jgi:D-alanine-D-alanine ligase|nr:isoprenoid biosynthesis glyoxalase ElbB [Bdellovibrionales bacterium]
MVSNTLDRKVAVILSGCGNRDGAEITEAISTIVALSETGAQYRCFAPNVDYKPEAFSSLTEKAPREARNAVEESGRIARGDIHTLDSLKTGDYDAMVFVGGFGAAKNLCSWATEGASTKVIPDVQRLIREFHAASKPIGAICIAPVLVALVLGKEGVEITLGAEGDAALEARKTGARVTPCDVTDYISDRDHKVLTTPAYMYDGAKPHEVFSGIRKMLFELVEMASSFPPHQGLYRLASGVPMSLTKSSKTRVAVFCGGQSAEHDVSLASGKNIADAMNPSQYEITLIAIDRQGIMRLIPSLDDLRKTSLDRPIDVTTFKTQVSLLRGPNGPKVVEATTGKIMAELDVAFPILHGPFGEDGTVQGYFKFIGLPFVGPSVLGSAAGMDKDVTKRLLRDAGLPVGKFTILHRHKQNRGETKRDFDSIKKELGTPFFVKPANMGSSIGIFKVSDAAKYETAIKEAFQYDTKLILEEFVDGREIECAVIGHHELTASPAAEIITQHEFYSYEAKYLDENGARIELPANITPDQQKEIARLSIAVCETLECRGLSRVDFFLRKSDGRFFVNEINTLPGFTKISMYPKMMEATGRTYSGLIDELIRLALERREEEAGLKVVVG